MVTFFLLLGLGNIALGLGLAVAHDRYRRVTPRQQASPGRAGDSGTAMAGGPNQEAAVTPPAHWQKRVDAAGITDASPLEVALWGLWRQADEVRQKLVPRTLSLASSPESPTADEEPVVMAGKAWASDLNQARQWLTTLVPAQASAAPITAWLAEYVAGIEHALQQLTATGTSDTYWHNNRNREGLWRLLEYAYRFRDEVEEHLIAELQTQQRIPAVPPSWRVDPLVSLHNRLGLEHAFQTFWGTADASQASLVLVDIDRFQRINRQLGDGRADCLLAAFGRLLDGSIRHERGFDRAARIGGQSFVLLFGNTPIAGAECVCERIRQVVEATSFRIDGQETEITVCCAALELSAARALTLSAAIARLQAALQEARKAGRNRTCVDGCEQSTVIPPRPYRVSGQVIEVHLPGPSPSLVGSESGEPR